MDLTSEQKRVVYTLGFCGLVSAADNWFVSPALPAIANALGISFRMACSSPCAARSATASAACACFT